MKKSIVIYPHLPFNESDGGIVVQYYLAHILMQSNIDVKIFNPHDKNANNKIFNNFITLNQINFDNTVVIYSEGVPGNPLNAKYVVRWILSKLGQNVPFKSHLRWGDNELVYFFNNELDLINYNIPAKFLNCFYINKHIKNLHMNRNGVCYTKRKSFIHKKIEKIHPDNAFEITSAHSQIDYIKIFNKHKMFISYDPLSFLSLIAPMCGCISIIYPVEGISRKEYFKMTSLYNYLNEKACDLYGVAYGNSNEQIDFAKNTLQFSRRQIEDIQKWYDNKITSFINDLDIFCENKNTVKQYKYYLNHNFDLDIDIFDVDFYKKINLDLQHMSINELIKHYKNVGKNENRFISEEQIKKFIEDDDFDVIFYKNSNPDLQHMSINKLVHYHKQFGKNQGRFGSEKEIKEFVKNKNFDIQFYKNSNPDLEHMSINKLVHHYKEFGKNKGLFGSEKEIKEFVEDENFDMEFYKNSNPDLQHMSIDKLVYHYKEFGKKEGLFGSEKEIKEFLANENFDINYFKLFNTHLNALNNRDVIKYYMKYKNWNICKLEDIDFTHLNTEIRKMTSYEEISIAFAIPMYDIYDKSTFLKHYTDFDIDFYKNKYLNDNNMSETEIFLHYHEVGKKQKFLTNNKITIVFYAMILNMNCGGLIVMHNMVKMINELNNPNIQAKIFNPYNLKYENNFTDKFCSLDEINDNYIIVYPEIIFGNPLNIKNVVRWILLDLGIEMDKNHYINWNKNDLLYFWESKSTTLTSFKQLSYPWFNPIFKNTNKNERKETCYIIKKATLFHKNINYIHPKDSILIDDYHNHSNGSYTTEVSSIFNQCKYLYCYDPNTAFILFSAICGCIPIVHPCENVTKEEYLKNRIFNCGGKLIDFIAYGNSIDEIKSAEKNIKKINKYIEYIKNYYKNTILDFVIEITDINNLHEKPNTIEKYYSTKNINNYKFIGPYDKYNLYDEYNYPGDLYDILYIENNKELDLFEYQKQYFVNNNITYYDNYYKIEKHEKVFKWYKESLENGKIRIYSPWSKSIIESDVYFTINTIIPSNVHSNKLCICNYYFDKEKILMGTNLYTCIPMATTIMYIINFNLKEIICWNSCYKNIIINSFDQLMSQLDKLNNSNLNELNKKNITIYSFQENIGHQIFNELTGLYLLQYYNLFQYIDNILIGKNNVLKLTKLFENNKIIKIENDIENCIGKGILFKYNNYFISNKCVKFYCNYLDQNFTYEEEFLYELDNIKNHYPIINITLRTYTFYMVNQEIILTEVINKLTELYPNAYFLLDGYCKPEYNSNNNEILNQYLTIADKIKSNIKTNNCKIIVNYEIDKLIKYYKLCNYAIYQVGSICCLSAWLCNVPGVQFGRNGVHIYESIDKNIKENMPKIKYTTENIKFYENYYEITSDNIVKQLPSFNNII